MDELTCDPGIEARDVLMAFSRYGFRKTSMEDIGRAAGLSRQTIYTKFGSKEACFEWVLKTYLSDLYGQVFDLLAQETATPLATLQTCFDMVVGEAVEFGKTPHGAEMLESGMQISGTGADNLVEKYGRHLARFLQRHGLAETQSRADDLAHLLITSSRGALLNAITRKAFSDDMKRVLATVLA